MSTPRSPIPSAIQAVLRGSIQGTEKHESSGKSPIRLLIQTRLRSLQRQGAGGGRELAIIMIYLTHLLFIY
jgi:hypothetical protein